MSLSARISVEEYLARDWPPNSQLIEGKVVVTNPALGHQRAVGHILGALSTWCRAASGRGEACFGCNWVSGFGANVYKPDVWRVREVVRRRDLDLDAPLPATPCRCWSWRSSRRPTRARTWE